MNGVGKCLRFREIGRGRFAPQHVNVRRIGQATRDGRFDPPAELIEAFGRAFAVNEFAVARIRVGEQQSGGIGVGARDENRRHAADVGGQPRSDEFLDELARGHHNFAA